MHAYGTDAEDRWRVPVFLAVAAVIAALLLYQLPHAIKASIPWWVDVPSVMGFYGIFRTLFDRFVWRWRIGGIALSQIPDIRGTWVGEVRSSFPGGLSKITVVIHIQQTWSRLCIRLLAEHSSSVSESATLNTLNSARDGLSYMYLNEPNVFSVGTMHVHRGTSHLRLAPNAASMAGDYFSGRDRQQIGTIKLRLISRHLLTYEEASRQEASVPAEVLPGGMVEPDPPGTGNE